MTAGHRPALGALVLLSLAGLLACQDGMNRDAQTQCFIGRLNNDPLWLDAALQAAVTSPNLCPINIAVGATKDTAFAGIITGDPAWINTTAAGTIATTVFPEVRNATYEQGGRLVNEYGVVPQFYFSGAPPRSEPRVTYTAGSGSASPSDPFGADGHDWGYIQVRPLRNGFTARGIADLSWTRTVNLSITAPPSGISTGSQATLSAPAGNYNPPLSYRWYRNGMLVGSGATYTTTWAYTGSYDMRVQVQDADGDQGLATRTIVVGASGGGGGGGGSGCTGGEPVPNVVALDTTAGSTARLRPSFAQQVPCD